MKTEKILNALANKSLSRKLPCHIGCLGNNNKYRQQMLLDIKEHTNEIDKQEKSQKQRKLH